MNTIYSRCVNRSKRSPESNAARNCSDDLVGEKDIDCFQFQVATSNRHISPNISAAVNNASFIESGWVLRKEGEAQNCSHPGSALTTSIDQVHSVSGSIGYDSLNSTQEPGTIPYARHRLQSIHSLPHPSELRRKYARKRQRTEIECPVNKHIHQLVKKKNLYYNILSNGSGTSVTEEVQPPPTIEDSTKDEIISTDQHQLPCLPLNQPTVDSFVAQVPITKMPIVEANNPCPLTKPDSREREEEDDDIWMRQHWQSRSTSDNPVSAPRAIGYTSSQVSVLLNEDHIFVSSSRNHMSTQKAGYCQLKPPEE